MARLKHAECLCTLHKIRPCGDKSFMSVRTEVCLSHKSSSMPPKMFIMVLSHFLSLLEQKMSVNVLKWVVFCVFVSLLLSYVICDVAFLKMSVNMP